MQKVFGRSQGSKTKCYLETLHKYQNDYQRKREGIHILQIEFKYHVRTLYVLISGHPLSSYCKYFCDAILDIIIHPHYAVFQKHYIIVSQKYTYSYIYIYISTLVYDIVHLYPTCYCPPPLPHHWTPWHPQGKEAQFLPARERFEATCSVSQLLDRTYGDVFGDLYLNVTCCNMSSNVVWPWLSFMLLIDVDCGGVYRYMKEYIMWIMHVYSCKYLHKKKSTVHSSIMRIDA